MSDAINQSQSKSNSDHNFEKLLSELEGLVSDLEKGNLGLDESLNKFEEGVNKFKECRRLLTNTEKRISLLTESLKEVDYDIQDEQ